MPAHRLYSTHFGKLKRNVFGIYVLDLCQRLRSLRAAATALQMTEASIRNYLAALGDIQRGQLFRIENGIFVLTEEGSALLARNAALIDAVNGLTGAEPEVQHQFLICCQPSVMTRILIPLGEANWSYFSSSRPEDLAFPADVTIMRTADPVLIRRCVVSFPEELVFLKPAAAEDKCFFVGEPSHESVVARYAKGRRYRFSAINDPLAVVEFGRHARAIAVARLFYCAADIRSGHFEVSYAGTAEHKLCIWTRSVSPETGKVISRIREHVARMRASQLTNLPQA